MTGMADELINWQAFAETRALFGDGFVRILGYFREDGMKSVATIEEAMRLSDSAKLVLPAHTLKGEAWQFGAEKLASLCEELEVSARRYVEMHQDPADLVEKIVQLRPLFETTLDTLERQISPLSERRPQNFAQPRLFGNALFGRA